MRITKLLLATSAMLTLGGCGSEEEISTSEPNPYKFHVPSGDYMCNLPGLFNKVITLDDLNGTVTIKTYQSISDLDNGVLYDTKTFEFDFKEYQFDNKSDDYYVYGDSVLYFQEEDAIEYYGIYYTGYRGEKVSLCIYEYDVSAYSTVEGYIHDDLTPLNECSFRKLQTIPNGVYTSKEKTQFSNARKSEGVFYVVVYIENGSIQVNRKRQLTDPNEVVCTLKPLDVFGSRSIGNSQERIHVHDYSEEEKAFIIARSEDHDITNSTFNSVEVFFQE